MIDSHNLQKGMISLNICYSDGSLNQFLIGRNYNLSDEDLTKIFNVLMTLTSAEVTAIHPQK